MTAEGRRRWTAGAWVCAVAAASACAAAVSAQSRPTSARNEPAMEAAVRSVEEANTPEAALKAFLYGCNLDRKSLALHRAYLRQMLLFGQPDSGVSSARALADGGAGDGAAYWTLCYCSGRKSDYLSAFQWSIQAALCLPDANGVQFHLGQLTAWFESAKIKLSEAEANELERVTTALSTRPAYAAGYQIIKTLTDRLQTAADVRERISLTADQGRVEEKATLAAQAAVDKLTEQLASLQSRINHLDEIAADRASPRRIDAGDQAIQARKDLAAATEELDKAKKESDKHAKATLELKAKLENLLLQTPDGIDKFLAKGPRLDPAERRRLQELSKSLKAGPLTFPQAFQWVAPTAVTLKSATQPARPS